MNTCFKFSGTKPNTQWKALPKCVLDDHPRFIPLDRTHGPEQRSVEWHEMRRKLTASKAASYLDFYSPIPASILKLENYYIKEDNMEKVFNEMRYNLKYTNNCPPFEVQNFGKICMDWGTHHENNAVYSLLTKFPNIKVHETTIVSTKKMMKDGGMLELGATPDGLIDIVNEHDQVIDNLVLEIKCPAPFYPLGDTGFYRYFKKPPHANIPVIYIPQLMMQLGVTGREKATYLSWTPTCGLNVFGIKFDKWYYETMLELIYSLERDYAHRNIKPKANHYLSTPMKNDYRDLLLRTLEISEKSAPMKGENYEITVRNSTKNVSYGNDNQTTCGGVLFFDD